MMWCFIWMEFDAMKGENKRDDLKLNKSNAVLGNLIKVLKEQKCK